MSTIQDVAREANVSIATVSRVLQNSPNVLPATRERVERAIQILNYHPNKLAQQFRTQETRNILVIVPEIGNTFYHDILSGIEDAAEKSGYHVLIADTRNNARLEEHFFESLVQKQIDGLITFSARMDPREIKRYADQFPIVVACRYFDEILLPNVTIDNTKATKDIVTYLLNLGHTKICYIAGDSNILLYQDRLKGYISALESRNIPVDQSLIIECAPGMKGGYDAMTKLLGSFARFTAVVAGGDTMAVGAINALRDYNFRVPDDVAVVGFDDIDLSSLFEPTLTTVRQPKYLIGIRSMEKLLDIIAGKPSLTQRDVLDYELIIRKSSGDHIGTNGSGV